MRVPICMPFRRGFGRWELRAEHQPMRVPICMPFRPYMEKSAPR
ncbi:hypothetical protein SAMN05421783_110127 [Thiocapsa roseopersicina]|uniref:Uncharacterized protein n=1 Tax=Thiocapsa roseopersicina TaxID=1058 RepID=A0A1H2XBT7_THIRO|nr:hypothetical protein SAMN05421783_110127 [Thiocapsa roseopersicina]